MKKQILMMVLFIFGLVANGFAEEVTVNLSHSKVNLNETFSLGFSINQNLKKQPDFSPLTVDFDLLSTTHGSKSFLKDGKASQETCWNLVLRPKREGKLTIPSIKFGSSLSKPQVVEVTPAEQAKQGDEIFLETEVYPKDAVYEQSCVTYTIRLYCSLRINQAVLSELETNDPDAAIQRLGADREYQHFHKNGKRYTVVERKYAVFPQHIGELVFSPIVFESSVITSGRSIFDFQTQNKRLYSSEEKVQVKPIPATFQKNSWLPANDVTLTEEWSADPSKMTLGDPITWTITLKADGCPGNQIPDMALALPDELKHYLDKPQVTNESSINGIVGTKQVKVALIATKAGAVVLPELYIKWWDLKADQARTAILPSRTLQVEPVKSVVQTATTGSSSDDLIALQDAQDDNDSKESKSSQDLPMWVWVLVDMNILLVLGVAIILYLKINRKKTTPDTNGDPKSRLKSACRANDAKEAEVSLLAWSKPIYPQVKPLNLMGIKPHLSNELQEALDELYQALYGKQNNWTGEALWKAFTAFKLPKRPHSSVENQKPFLKELYPNS